MRNRTILRITAALFPSLLFAQQKFVPGYVVTAAGDTIKGEVKVNEKKPQDQYAKVMLRDERGMQKTYKPDKVKAYGWQDHRFIALDDGQEPAFYRLVVEGPVTLLEMKYEGMRMNKIVLESEYYLRLEGEKYLQQVKQRNFRKQLTDAMEDNEEIAAQYPEDKQFDEEAASSVINAYNTWKSGQAAQQ